MQTTEKHFFFFLLEYVIVLIWEPSPWKSWHGELVESLKMKTQQKAQKQLHWLKKKKRIYGGQHLSVALRVAVEAPAIKRVAIYSVMHSWHRA